MPISKFGVGFGDVPGAPLFRDGPGRLANFPENIVCFVRQLSNQAELLVRFLGLFADPGRLCNRRLGHFKPSHDYTITRAALAPGQIAERRN